MARKEENQPLSIGEELKNWFFVNRRFLVWTGIILGAVGLIWAVREVATLLLLAYIIALLLDPLVTRLEKERVPRAISILAIGFVLSLVVLLVVLVAGPTIVEQLGNLIQETPRYVARAGEKLANVFAGRLGTSVREMTDKFSADIHAQLSGLGAEDVQNFLGAFWGTLLRGYSLTLTIVNLVLLPFFIFYITRDLRDIHRAILGFLAPNIRDDVETVGREILEHIQAFFKGQFTVCLVLAILYSIGLWIIGLPWSFALGTVSGFLNFIPYLGFATGVIVGSIITLVNDGGFWGVGQVLLVFGIINAFEGNILTPKVVGEKVGLHPLGVMLALIVGGQLFGLLGLIVAIPAAASIRVLVKHLVQVVEEPAPVILESGS